MIFTIFNSMKDTGHNMWTTVDTVGSSLFYLHFIKFNELGPTCNLEIVSRCI